VSKLPAARRKPKGIYQGTHLDERAQGIPELRSQVILEPFKGIWSAWQAKLKQRLPAHRGCQIKQNS
jgi:hypothetical protein